MARRRHARPDPFAPRRFEPLEPPTGSEAQSRRRGRQVEFAPVTHVLPPRGGQYHTEDDPFFFPQRRPEGMQGLGSVDSEHTTKGNLDIQHAEIMAVSGADHADQGDCIIARHKLNEAHRAVGAAVAHSASGGRIVGITMVSGTVDNAEAHFARVCKVKGKR